MKREGMGSYLCYSILVAFYTSLWNVCLEFTKVPPLLSLRRIHMSLEKRSSSQRKELGPIEDFILARY